MLSPAATTTTSSAHITTSCYHLVQLQAKSVAHAVFNPFLYVALTQYLYWCTDWLSKPYAVVNGYIHYRTVEEG
jgi:hypothetical protein